MSRPIKDKTRRICATYRLRIAAGDTERDVITDLAAMNEVQRPAIWKALRSGGVVAPYAPKDSRGPGRPTGGGQPGYTVKRSAIARTAAERREDQMISSRPAPLEPCGWCGTRADLGCEHQPPAGAKPLPIERAEARR